MERPPVNPFKGGFVLIAKRASVPVQTVFLEASSPFLGKGWPLTEKPDFPLRYRLRLGERFTCPEHEGTKELVARIEEYYRSQLSP